MKVYGEVYLELAPALFGDGKGCLVDEARRLLEDPMRESGFISGPHATFNSHLSRQLAAAAAKPKSGFKFQQMSSKGARVQGRVSIVKSAAGRTPVAQLRTAQADFPARVARLFYDALPRDSATGPSSTERWTSSPPTEGYSPPLSDGVPLRAVT